MEVIFMNSGFRMTRIVDAFTSLIWNDRYYGYGDFELRFPMETDALAGIKEGCYASIRESDRYMIVEGINITTSTEEGNYATITGRSLESILERRICIDPITATNANIQSIIQRVLNANVINPKDSNRKIPNLVMKTSSDKTITNPKIDVMIERGTNVLDVIDQLCQEQYVGYRVIPNEDGSMVFELYRGLDRTYRQEANPWVVFSPKFENLKESEMDMTTENLKTSVYSYGEYTEKISHPIGGESTGFWTEENEKTIELWENGSVEGLERRELYKGTSIKPDDVDETSFGVPSDRVNWMDYATWEKVYFDSEGYKEAMDAYNKKLSDAYVPRTKEHTEWVSVDKEPGDPGYIPVADPGDTSDPSKMDWESYKFLGQKKSVLVTIPGDTDESFKQKNSRYYSIMENERPNEEDFYRWGWVLTDFRGYDAAIAQAQADIEAEIEAANAEALRVATDAISQEAKEILAPYQRISEFGGELESYVQYIFGRDYYLGDEVQIVNEFHFQAVTRVIGMMYSQEEGVGTIMRPEFESDDKAVFEL